MSIIKKALTKAKKFTKRKTTKIVVNKGEGKQELTVEKLKQLPVKTAKQLKFHDVGFKILSPVNKTIPAIADDYFTRLAETLPDKLLVSRVYNYSGKYMEIRYASDAKTANKSAIVSEDFEFYELQISDIEPDIIENFVVSNLAITTEYKPMIGADPEIFVVNAKDELLPAFNFLPKKPGPEFKRVMETNDRPVYWDGFQAEFETRPDTCFGWHTDRVQEGLKKLLKLSRATHKDAKLSIRTVMDIPQQLLEESKDEHVEFGCVPSLNIYGLEGNKRSGREVHFRPVGGHIHFGIGKQEPETIVRIVRALDAICAVACVSMFANFDDPRRRTLYGLPGEYRLPPHGIEYRTLSNAWLSHPVICNLVFDLARRCMNMGRADLTKYLNWTASQERTIKTIIECDVKEARKIMEENKGVYLGIFKANYYDIGRAEAAYAAFLNGIESIVRNPDDLEGNWNLTADWVVHSGGAGKHFASAFTLIKAGKKVA